MKAINTLIALMLALCLLSGAALAEEDPEEAVYSHLGEALPDFTVATIDGGSFTLSEALQEKDMVLVNLWATWCGPCRMEFPYMEEAYEQYKDRVAVIALSVEPEDTPEVLQDFAAEMGLTFPIGSDVGIGMGDIFATVGIPTTLAVDRFGNICMIEIGSQPSAGAFTRMFDAFLGDDYTESTVLYEVPPARPSVENPDDAALDAALNTEGGSLSFHSSDDQYAWPMIPADIDDRAALVSTNAGEPETESVAMTTVTANAGDALAFDFRTSTEPAVDLLKVSVDGAVVKSFGGEHDWTTWVIPLDEGEHEVAFSYLKDYDGDEGEDQVWLDEVRVISAGEAEPLLAALPVYPTAGESSVTIANPDAREIVFDDPDGVLYESFLCGSYWIVPSEAVQVRVTMAADLDPEAAFVYNNYDGLTLALAGAVDGDGYALTTGIDSLETTGYSYSNVYLYPCAEFEDMSDIRGAMIFFDEQNVNAFVEEMAAEDIETSWSYADGSAPATTDAAVGAALESVYTVAFVDQDGAPVPGCIINFCTDETCVPAVADENGIATFTGAPYAYHLQVIKVPEGYSFDTTQEFYAEEEGGELSFTVTRD